jgi:peptidoglycan biosynthesis protein MviN/MurJ (putative lipid II flippase)
VFTGYLTSGPRAEADRVARVLFTMMACVLAVITILGIVFAGPITALFAPRVRRRPGQARAHGEPHAARVSVHLLHRDAWRRRWVC